jgi:hypothetical protein
MPMAPLTMGQYAEIGNKTSSGQPRQYAHDGAATVYLYPAAAGHVITLRTKQAAQTFADLDTVYTMPAGYQSALEALLTEKMAPTLNPEMLPLATRKASAVRLGLASRSLDPAILRPATRGNILTGWQ